MLSLANHQFLYIAQQNWPHCHHTITNTNLNIDEQNKMKLTNPRRPCNCFCLQNTCSIYFVKILIPLDEQYQHPYLFVNEIQHNTAPTSTSLTLSTTTTFTLFDRHAMDEIWKRYQVACVHKIATLTLTLTITSTSASTSASAPIPATCTVKNL